MNNYCRCNACNGNLSNNNIVTLSDENTPEFNNSLNDNWCRCNACNGMVENAVLSTGIACNQSNNDCNVSNESVNNEALCTNVQNNNVANSNVVFNRNNVNRCPSGNLLNVLYNYLGRRCTLEFNTGRGIETKNGVLEGVGDNYILLRSCNNNKVMYCNICNLLFVTISC